MVNEEKTENVRFAQNRFFHNAQIRQRAGKNRKTWQISGKSCTISAGFFRKKE
ncbi:MAG: hypothetical protein ACLRTT_15810 [Lachnospiraceae bacterium]